MQQELLDAEHFFSQFPFGYNKKRGALLAMDVGEKTIGLAFTDSEWTVSVPYTAIKRTKFSKDAEELLRTAEIFETVGYIIGWPLQTNGEPGKRCQSTYDFYQEFIKLSPCPTLFWDERFTTQGAKYALEEAELRAKSRAKEFDSVAATLMLRGVIERLKNISEEKHGKYYRK